MEMKLGSSFLKVNNKIYNSLYYQIFLRHHNIIYLILFQLLLLKKHYLTLSIFMILEEFLINILIRHNILIL